MDRPPEVMSDAELAHALDQSDADLARIETRRLRIIAAMDKSGYAERVGARDMVQYVEFRYRLDHSRAYRDVKLSRALHKYPAVTAALPGFVDGEAPEPDSSDSRPEVLLRPAQAEAIVSALEKVPTTVPVADVEFAEEELVRLARHLAPTDLRKAAEQSRDILDTDGPEPEEHKAYTRESLTLKTADRGVKFNGYLANENAELLRTLVTAGARPHKTIDGDPDPRTREKRQADALTTTLTLAATALDAGTPSPTIPRPTAPASSPAGSPPAAGPTADADDAVSDSDAGLVAGAGRGASGDVVPGFGAKANITVTIDLEDLKAATADAIGQTIYSNGLSAATIRRLACDAKVIPIVLGSNSEPLDVGRAERLVTRAMRRALNTRDRGCVVCGAPPIMCDAHHLISWIDGGDTKTPNLVLLCRRHHSDLHHGHWTITITNGEVHVARPAWVDPPPRHPHKPPDETRRPHDPPDEAPRSHEPPGHGPTRSGSSDGVLTHAGNPRPQTSTSTDDPPGETALPADDPSGETALPPDDPSSETAPPGDDPSGEMALPADDPWGETALPAASASDVRPSRWHADESTRAEAARFAVWGERTPNGFGAGPPSFATI